MKKINKKRLKYGANSTMVLAFAVICVILLNAVALFAENKFSALKIDLTADNLTKITDETREVLKTVDEGDEEIDLIYLKGVDDESEDVMDVLKQYDEKCKNISLETVNYVKDPTVLKQYNISSTSGNALVVSNSDKTKYKTIYESDMWSTSGSSASFLLENKLTNAIGYLLSEREVNVVISQGHDEAETSVLVAALEEENASCTTLDLSTADIPEDTDIFMIMAPQSDFTQGEVDALDTYLSDGGNVVISFPFNVSLPHLEEYISEWGLEISDDIILEQDASKSYQQSGMYFYPSVTDNEITSSISKNIFASYARSLTYYNTGDIYASPMLTTSEDAYRIPIVGDDFDRDNMEEGQFNIGYMLEKPLNGSYDETAKLIVTSTPSVWGAINAMVTEYDYVNLAALSESRFGNRDLLVNTLSYTTGVDNVTISVPTKVSETAIMSLSVRESTILRLVLCIVLPLLVIFAGIAVWLKRRHM
jgi:hypothetical protein